MAGYLGYEAVAFARSMHTNLAKNIRELEESFLKNFQILALLEAGGRVSLNNGGRGFDWPVQYRIHNVEGNTGETQRNFARRNLFKTAYMEYRGYQATDSMFYREFLENRGPEGVVKVYDNFITRLQTSIKQTLGPECWASGYATGATTNWHGLESLFRVNTTTPQSVTATSGAARTANAADLVAYPDGNYAGIDVELGAYGGENESGEYWPYGVCDPDFDFWTPLICLTNTSHADLPGSTDTFAGQGDESLRFGIVHGQRNATAEDQITNIFLSRDYYTKLLNLLDGKEQVQVTGSMNLRAFGFKNVLIFDGIEVSWEGAIPSRTGYGVNWRNVELMGMDSDLLKAEGPEYDLQTQAFNAVVSTLSNFKFKSPRNFIKWCEVADLGKNDGV